MCELRNSFNIEPNYQLESPNNKIVELTIGLTQSEISTIKTFEYTE